MEAILDTNFVISCVKKKIDFLAGLEEQGFTPVLPREVFQELKDLRLTSTAKDREAIDVALTLFSQRKVKKTTLGNRNVDEGLIEKGKLGVHIATLDNGIKRIVPHTIGIDAARNTLLVG